MWSRFSCQTLAESGILSGMTDYHSHILPGVDDGISTLEETITTLIFYEKLGIQSLWLTPHIMEDYPNKTADLRQKFCDSLTAYVQKGSTKPITLHLSSENMLDALFLQRLEEDDVLPIIDGRHLLVETSYYNPPFEFSNLLDHIICKGYVPILAHPERYRYMSIHDCKELSERGVKLQLDLTAVVGAYGKDVQEKARALLKKDYYSILGSDLHRLDAFVRWLNVPLRKDLLISLQYLMNK